MNICLTLAFGNCVRSELEDSSFEGNAHLPSEGMRALLTRPEGQKTRMPHHQPTCAMFYSVNSPQDSLCEHVVTLFLILPNCVLNVYIFYSWLGFSWKSYKKSNPRSEFAISIGEHILHLVSGTRIS